MFKALEGGGEPGIKKFRFGLYDPFTRSLFDLQLGIDEFLPDALNKAGYFLGSYRTSWFVFLNKFR